MIHRMFLYTDNLTVFLENKLTISLGFKKGWYSSP